METIYIKQVIKDKSCEILTHYEVVEHNGKKYLVYVKAENGYPCGFNTNCCISVMNDGGNWDKLVDNKMLGFSSENDTMYYSHNAKPKKDALEKIVKEFKDYITNVC